MAEVVKYAANLPLDKTPNQMVGEHGCAATISVQVCEWETRINGTISVQTITPQAPCNLSFARSYRNKVYYFLTFHINY